MAVARRLWFPNVAALAAAVSIALGSDLSAQFPRPVQRDESYPQRCGVGGAASDMGAYFALPRGDVFCPLIADPKATRSFVAYQRGNETDLATDIAAVGIADQFPFFRAAAGRPGNGIQLGLAGAVFAQFDLGSPSYDLLNADYTIALPLTLRAGPISAR